MSINLSAPHLTELKPRIVVIGVGGAGGNAVNNMIQSDLGGVEFIVANTDAQALASSQAERKIQLGVSITQGLGSGAQPEVGRAAAEEAIGQIMDHMQGAHMVFITAGMGGGTGTGGASVIAQACREFGILTVGVVTKPFHFEGTHRMRIAEAGIDQLQAFVDTQIIIPNQNLFRVANEKTTFADAFAMADQVLNSGVRGITDLMVMPGLINLDFADVKTVMSEMGKAMMGTGEAEGEKRATDAAEAAISNPLLDDVTMNGARGLLINITGGLDLTLYEVDEAANRIREEVDPEANIIVGSALDDSLNGRMRVSVVATGIDAEAMAEPKPVAAPRLYAVGGAAAATETPTEPEPAVSPTSAVGPETQVSAVGAPISIGQTAIAQEPVAEATVAPPAPAGGPLFSRLGAAVPERVPLAKPLAPEPDPMPMAKQEEAPESVEEAPFIAPEPVEPKVRPASLGRPDPIAEADAVNAGAGAPRRQSRGLNLFRRMAAVGRGTEVVEEAERAKHGEAVGRAEPRISESSVAPAEPEAATPIAPSPTSTAAVVTAPAEPEERLVPAKPEEDGDLLGIPSFLRRQAN